MRDLLKKYEEKLVLQGLCNEGRILFAGIDETVVWNQRKEESAPLEKIIKGLNINSLLFAPPAEPFRQIIQWCVQYSGPGAFLKPEDSETRTFLHDIPISSSFAPQEIISLLKNRKGVIVPEKGIITWGSVSPEQAFITYSSICFSVFVMFFVKYFFLSREGNITDFDRETAHTAFTAYEDFLASVDTGASLMEGPFNNGADVVEAISQAGRRVVNSRMVDSFFGNISYKFGNTVFISQTGSSLDELEACIDPCPVDDSSCNAITASSEFSAHRSLYDRRPIKAILHGHPKFTVIMSMLCEKPRCVNRGKCHTHCTEGRSVAGIPVVPGEVGTGPTGIAATLPPALTGKGAIVYGHGIFCAGEKDFNIPYKTLISTEKQCLAEYKRLTSL